MSGLHSIAVIHFTRLFRSMRASSCFFVFLWLCFGTFCCRVHSKAYLPIRCLLVTYLELAVLTTLTCTLFWSCTKLRNYSVPVYTISKFAGCKQRKVDKKVSSSFCLFFYTLL